MPDQNPNQESDAPSAGSTPDEEVAPSADSADSSPASPSPGTPNPATQDQEEAEDLESTTTEQDATATVQDSPPDAADASPSVDNLHFEDDNLAETLRHANEEQLDNAPFGIIQVDDEGTIEFFNQYESDLSGMDPEEVKGRNFFTQVAPCTNNRLFRGRFKKGIRRGELDETFSYTYTYKMRPTLVDIRLCRDEEGNNWITVQKY
jgi:photoactive yellow protein